LVVDVTKGKIAEQRYESLDSPSPFLRAKRLFELGIEVLICGAISDFLARMIEAYGIHMVAFVSGNVHEVLEAYLQDKLRGEGSHVLKGRARRRRRRRAGDKPMDL
jgi:predicted Fe-Mo cluster-binding NifX family protein